MFDSAASSHKEGSRKMCHANSNDASSTFGGASSSRGPPRAATISDLDGPTPVSTTSAFLVGIHNYKSLDHINLPEFVREHQATLTFPEKLMLLLTYVDQEYKTKGADANNTSISWILDGRAFIIRSKEDLVKHLLPMFFRQAKFASFTRKLYRWGFRQVSVAQERTSSSSRREIIFGHEFFQRDNKSLMARMRSVTAAGTRRAIASKPTKQQQNGEAEGQEKLAIEPKKANGQSFSSKMILTPPGALLAPMPGAYQCSNQMLGCCGVTGNCQVSGMAMTSGAFVAHGCSLSEALAMTHNDRSLTLGQQQPKTSAPVVDTTKNKEVTPGKAAGETQGEGAAPPIATKANTFSSRFPHALTSSADLPLQVVATHERIRTTQRGGGKPLESSSDPNAYMRAAVDMLLRYAS